MEFATSKTVDAPAIRRIRMKILGSWTLIIGGSLIAYTMAKIHWIEARSMHWVSAPFFLVAYKVREGLPINLSTRNRRFGIILFAVFFGWVAVIFVSAFYLKESQLVYLLMPLLIAVIVGLFGLDLRRFVWPQKYFATEEANRGEQE